MVWGLSWRFLNLDMTLGSRTLTKGKKKGERKRESSACDNQGSGSEERMLTECGKYQKATS